jgi:hypothetical protein|tara:strand:- start:42 stop:194 length:153 start_codon:yes stop_codon:yes gene_type:complete
VKEKKEESDEEEAAAIVNKGKNFNNLFSGKADDSDAGSAEGSGDEEADNF